MLLSQEVSAVPPWLGLIIQGGSFALICFIVGYLYPKLAKESRDAQDKREESWRALVRELQVQFNERNDKVTAAFDKQTTALSGSFSLAADRIERAVTSACKGFLNTT